MFPYSYLEMRLYLYDPELVPRLFSAGTVARYRQRNELRVLLSGANARQRYVRV